METSTNGRFLTCPQQGDRVKTYSYNHNFKPALVDAVRGILKQSPIALSFDDLMQEVEKLDIASYDARDAVRVILSRLRRSGEVAANSNGCG